MRLIGGEAGSRMGRIQIFTLKEGACKLTEEHFCRRVST